MDRGTMRMAMHDAIDLIALQRAQHFVLIDIHDLRRGLVHRGDVRLAAGAHALGQPLALPQAQPAQDELHDGIANDPAQPLVGGVVDAQRIAVHEQDPAPVQRDDRAIGEQAHAGLLAKALADQEVTVAMDQVARHSTLSERAQRADDPALVRIGVVVADPGLEQVAEDVKRLRAAGFMRQEIEKLRGDVGPLPVEMQIGNEQRGHLIRVTLRMTTGFKGASLSNGPTWPVATAPMSSTTSMPSTTRPNTA